jgi:hypothetical protein
MLQMIRKWLAIRSYKKRLGPQLRERYGRARSYTSAQVKRTIQEGGFNAADYVCYALCMYCDRTEFDAYHESTGEVCDYDAMWHDLGGTSHSHEAFTLGGHDVDHWSHHDVGHGGDHGGGHGHDGY